MNDPLNKPTVHFECSVPECNGRTGYTVRAIDADNFERFHGCFDEHREHVLRKTGES